MTDVLVVGDANPDLVLRGDVVPRFGQAEQLLDGADVVLGGSASILAHGLARLGRDVRLVARIGDDVLGDLVHRLLAEGGVEVTDLVRDPASATGLTVVLSAGDDRAILTHLGAIGRLTADDARAALEAAAPAGVRHLHVASLFLLPDLAAGLPQLLERARALGLSTSLDTNDDPAGAWDGVAPLLEHLDLLLPNRSEAMALAARTGAATDDLETAAVALAAHGPTVVVKDGERGALLARPDGTVLRADAVAVAVVDTTGAGDTFDAGYVDAFLAGLDPAACLRRAVLAGALSTTGVGGTAAQPTSHQLTVEGGR